MTEKVSVNDNIHLTHLATPALIWNRTEACGLQMRPKSPADEKIVDEPVVGGKWVNVWMEDENMVNYQFVDDQVVDAEEEVVGAAE